VKVQLGALLLSLFSRSLVYLENQEYENHGQVLAHLGEVDEALKRIRECEQILEHLAARGILGFFGWTYFALGRASLLLDRLDEAKRLADHAVERSPRQLGYTVHAWHLLGDIASHRARFDPVSAAAHYRQTLEVAEPRGMRPLVAHCHIGLGRLATRAGRSRTARDHFARATMMYREMGMGPWLVEAEREASRGGAGASRGAESA